MPAKKPISPRPQAVKTATHLQSTKINKNPFVTRTFRPSLKECFCILYFWNRQQKRKKISARQFSTCINKLACEVWSCFGHSILAKNLGDILARGLSYQGLEAFEARPQSASRPGLKGLEDLIEWLGAGGTSATFPGEIFFLSKVPEFFRVLFN